MPFEIRMSRRKDRAETVFQAEGKFAASTRGRKEGVAAGKKVLRLPGYAWGTVDHLGEGRNRSSTL